jgi:hypothetical protein
MQQPGRSALLKKWLKKSLRIEEWFDGRFDERFDRRFDALHEKRLDTLLALTKSSGEPNINALWKIAKDIENIKLNLKFFGYELAKDLAATLPPPRVVEPVTVGLTSKPSTQADIASDWVAYWCGQLHIARVFHRKVWEFAYALQAIHEQGHLKPGARGLGFGCGEEPLPSYLASVGVDVTVTDLDPEQSATLGWRDSGQHTSNLEKAFKPDIVTREAFERHVRLAYVDMNAIPSELRNYDFCWSICSYEHMGSIAKGVDFMGNAMDTLRPGGLSVHTTEFNFLNDVETIDNAETVLFQKRHFTEMAQRLRANGHWVAELDFDVGSDPIDKFIDLPPFLHDWQHHMKESWADSNSHIKCAFDGFASTCFGLIAVKGGA